MTNSLWNITFRKTLCPNSQQKQQNEENSRWQFCVKTIVSHEEKIQRFTMKIRKWRINFKNIDKLTMLRNISFMTKKFEKIFE